MTRRQTLTGGALAVLGTGFLGRVDKVAAAQRPLSLTDVLGQQATGTSEALLLGPTPGEEGPPEPATYDRLPLEWNRKTVKRFKDKLAELDIEAFLVQKPLNVIYLTGYWHSSTERPQATFFNRDDEDPWFCYPSLDRDLVTEHQLQRTGLLMALASLRPALDILQSRAARFSHTDFPQEQCQFLDKWIIRIFLLMNHPPHRCEKIET